MNNDKPNKLLNILYIFLILITAFLISLAIEINVSYNCTTFERIIYTLINMDNMASFSTLGNSITKVISTFIIIIVLVFFPLYLQLFYKKKIYINLFKRKFIIYPINLKYVSFVLLFFSFSLLLFSLKVPSFLLNNLKPSTLYENYYVKYDSDFVKFPEDKKNLITIYVESFESSVFSLKNGGTNKLSYMPLLEDLTDNYIHFSNNNKIGGFYEVNGTSWTAASIVAQTSGVPLYIRTKNDKGRFLEGATSIGEILKDNGYKNYFLMGSDANFAERDNYLLEHGDYEIFDYNSAIENKLIEEDYYVWWGYEDRKLYSYARDMLIDISKKKEPFNFSMLTADTHFYDGYTDYACFANFDSNYANSYYCTDLMLYDFINWLQEQDFYDNTTVVIVGDHLTMRDDFFDTGNNYDRTVYNLFINSSVKSTNTNNRYFTAFDMYPTTLASIGVSIDGDRIALGTNLFSEKKTIMEELGKEVFDKKISQISKYYNTKILKD